MSSDPRDKRGRRKGEKWKRKGRQGKGRERKTKKDKAKQGNAREKEDFRSPIFLNRRSNTKPEVRCAVRISYFITYCFK